MPRTRPFYPVPLHPQYYLVLFGFSFPVPVQTPVAFIMFWLPYDRAPAFLRSFHRAFLDLFLLPANFSFSVPTPKFFHDISFPKFSNILVGFK